MVRRSLGLFQPLGPVGHNLIRDVVLLWPDQALRRTSCNPRTALRLAMKSARRLPRAHGMVGISCSAACVIDLMKRAFVI